MFVTHVLSLLYLGILSFRFNIIFDVIFEEWGFLFDKQTDIFDERNAKMRLHPNCKLFKKKERKRNNFRIIAYWLLWFGFSPFATFKSIRTYWNAYNWWWIILCILWDFLPVCSTFNANWLMYKTIAIYKL